MNDLKINSVISFKHPLKKSKTFTGKILSINESKKEVEVEIFPIPGSKEKQLVKIAVPEKNIKAVLDIDNNIAKEYKPVKELSKVDTKKIEKEEVYPFDKKSAFAEIFNFFNKNVDDCPCILVPVKMESGEQVLKFKWNKRQFDEYWNEDCVLPLEAVVTENDAVVNVTFTQPFSQNFVINKGAEEGTLINGIVAINNSLDRIIDAVKGKYMLFKAQHKGLVSDAEDYVDAVLNRAVYTESVEKQKPEDVSAEEAEQQTEQQQIAIDPVDEKFVELTDESRVLNNIKLYRIKAVKDIKKFEVKAGTLGGWVQSLNNINKGWVGKDATVIDKAIVDGLVTDYAVVSGKCYIGEDAIVSKSALVSNNVKILGKASIKGKVSGNIKVLPKSELVVTSKAKLTGKVVISGDVSLTDHAEVNGGLKGLSIDSAMFNSFTAISANGLIQGNPVFTGRNTITGEVKVDTRNAQGSVFSGIESAGSFKIKGAQVVQVDSKPVKAKEETQQLQESQTIIKEIGPDSIAKDSKLKSYGVKNPKQWKGPLVKLNAVKAAQIEHLNELVNVLVDAGETPVDFEMDPEEIGAKEICINVANKYQFFATLTDEGKIDTMWMLEPLIINQQEEVKPELLSEDSFNVGDIIQLKPEIADKGEEEYSYKVLELRGDRVYCELSEPVGDMTIVPTFVFLTKWIMPKA